MEREVSELKQIMASEVGVRPYQIKGYEAHGLLYSNYYGSDACGVQCGNCHIIVWFNPREISIFQQKKPDYVPDSGPGYKAYRHDRHRRFMKSLPLCPVCGKQAYDLFVNNRTLVRFEDGTPWPEHEKNEQIVNIDPQTIKIWWYEE